MDTSSRLLLGILLCIFVFAGAWYDSVHMHSLTASINQFIQHDIVFSSTPTGPWPMFYRESLTFISMLGKPPVVVLTTALLLVILAIRKEWTAIFYCLVAGFVIVSLGLLSKEFIFSPRPFPFEAEHDSFPSGHVFRTSVWCGLYLFMDKLKYISLSRFARWGFMIIPILVAISRLGLSRHWLSDVIGAFALVLGIFFCLYWLILWINRSKHVTIDQRF